MPGTTSSVDEPLAAEQSEPRRPRPAISFEGVATRRNALLAAVVVLAVAILVFGTRGGGGGHAPTPDPPGRPVSGWFPYWVGDWSPETTPFDANQTLFDSVSPFWYQAGAAGSTDPAALTASTSDGADIPPAMVEALRAAGVPVIPSIVDAYDAGGMAAILADPAKRTAHVEALAALAASEQWDGIDIDYEKFAFSDGASTWDATRPNWVAFVQELSTRLHADRRQLVVTTPAQWKSDGKVQYRIYDWAAIAPYVDTLRVMTYDWSVNEAGPLAPLHWVRDTLEYATEANVPPAKLQLGIPTYGKDWVTSTSGTCPTDADTDATSVPLKEMDALVAGVGATPERDESSGEMRFTYTSTATGNAADGTATTCTLSHSVWYLDATAIGARAQLAADHGSGVALWALGYETPATWEAIHAAYPPLPPTTATSAQP